MTQRLKQLLFSRRATTLRPRVVMVAAHPDDESVGAGGSLNRLQPQQIVYVTDGSPRNLSDAYAAGCTSREAYAAVRQQERKRAFAVAGIPLQRLDELGVADQEASRHLAALAWLLAARLNHWRADLVVTHPYEGGHPDHDATAFAVHGAQHLLQREHLPAPRIVEMTSYHGRNGEMITGEFLPHLNDEIHTITLTDRQRALKRRLFDCYATQQPTLAAFRIDQERFRMAPRYDFSQPPHAGELFYERFAWGMTGPRWRKLADAALYRLGLSEAASC